jgi:hypothetical protein
LLNDSLRAQVVVDEENEVVGYGDAKIKKEAEHLAAMDGLMQLVRLDLLEKGLVKAKQSKKAKAKEREKANKDVRTESGTSTPKSNKEPTATLTDGSVVIAERAREFMSFYCTHFKYVLCYQSVYNS